MEAASPASASGERPPAEPPILAPPEEPRGALAEAPPGIPANPLLPLGKDVCPIKPEFLRAAPARVQLGEDDRTRGMNKGAARAHSAFVAGTQRPTLEGERNFFTGPALQVIKGVLRRGKGGGAAAGPPKRPRAAADDVAGPLLGPRALSDDVAGPLLGPRALSDDVAGPLLGPRALSDDFAGPLNVGAFSEAAGPREAAARARGLFRDRLVLAPLTTVGNLPFRRVCKALGADITVGEMALARPLARLQQGEWALLRRHADEDVFGVQLAVAGPAEAAAVARALEASDFAYDFLDLNAGCPVERVVGFGCGCGLWERRARLQAVVGALARHQSRPVSVKCRIGPEDDAPALHAQIGAYAGWGAAAVAIHGRSRKQRYTKLANWDYIEHCATLTELPVIGNGDIFAPEDVARHRDARPHVSSFMIGRGALIKPWIFDEIKSGRVRDISASERLDLLRDFCRFGLAHWGADERGVLTTRRFLCEWLSFFHRYVPVGLLERLPQRIHDRPPYYVGRSDLETLLASDSVVDWIRISEMLLGPAGEKFRFTPKHKSNSYERSAGAAEAVEG